MRFQPNQDLISDRVIIIDPGEEPGTAKTPYALFSGGADYVAVAAPVPDSSWKNIDFAAASIQRIAPFARIIIAPLIFTKDRFNGYGNFEFFQPKDCIDTYIKIGGVNYTSERIIGLSLQKG